MAQARRQRGPPPGNANGALMDQDIGTSHHATPVRTTLHEMASGANPDRRAWKHDGESRQFASGEWVGACDSPL